MELVFRGSKPIGLQRPARMNGYNIKSLRPGILGTLFPESHDARSSATNGGEVKQGQSVWTTGTKDPKASDVLYINVLKFLTPCEISWELRSANSL